MPLVYDDAGFRSDRIGMPKEHADCFKRVAEMQKCVILSRATGPTCKQLLEQGYDTKGFRIHGKSCDWGPMAGFVLRDPRLNKYGAGKADFNADEHKEALTDARSGAGWTASTTPLKIYESRRKWLEKKNERKTTLGTIVQKNADHWVGEINHAGVRFPYDLIRDPLNAQVWGVWIDTQRKGHDFVQERGTSIVAYREGWGTRYQSMLAMTNPPEHRSWPAGDFRNAVTGDYDLFAIWPFQKNYDHHGADRRVLGTVKAWTQSKHIAETLERRFTESGQGTKLGNMTNRIYEVAQFLNSMIGATGCTDDEKVTFPAFPNRMVVWHSDEQARPFVNDVDLPVIAFTPTKREVGISTITDLKIFVGECLRQRIQVLLAEGWVLPTEPGKANRMGSEYAPFVPHWKKKGMPGLPLIVPDWYNS